VRNEAEVLIDQDGVYLAIGIDRSDEDLAHFVRLDLNGTTLLLGPKKARALAARLMRYAMQASSQ
jgi:hypothetical protein